MENNEKKHRCFRGYSPDTCPMHDLEVTKHTYFILLVVAIAMIAACNFAW